MNNPHFRLFRQLFPTPLAYRVWLFLFVVLVPWTAFIRVQTLSTPLVDVHPIRQGITGLIVYQFKNLGAKLWDYRYPSDGSLWNWVQEFPLYEFIAAKIMGVTGLPLEISARSLTLIFFIMSLFALVLLVRDLFGGHAASWAGLFYWISPFNVVYSRSCLIDFPALSFILFSHWALLKNRSGPRALSMWFWLSMALGILGGTIKVFLWYPPAIFMFIYLAYGQPKKEPFIRKRDQAGLLSLTIQGLIIVFWILWAKHFGGGRPFSQDAAWLFGTFSERLDLSKWWAILRVPSRMILQDWLLVPFFLAWTASNYRKWIGGLTLLCFFPYLVLFHVNVYHDYYAITQVAYFIAITSVGMVQLWALPKMGQVSALGIMAVLLAYRLTKFESTYGVMYKTFESELEEAHLIKAVTHPEDFIYAPKNEDSWYLALYSQRFINVEKDRKESPIEFSVFRFEPNEERLELLNSYDLVWVVPDRKNSHVYRVKARAGFEFAQDEHTAVAKTPFSTPHRRLTKMTETDLNPCLYSPSLQLEIPKKASEIEIRSAMGRVVRLPAKRFLNLSGKTMGCRVKVALR